VIWRFWSSAYVQHLEAEILYLRTAAQQAQQRYEVAIAALVALKTDGQANVAPRPLIAEREADVDAELKTLQANSEWAGVGS
jgi:hypothetical protein